MRLQELLLETTEEDRALISLSSAIYNYIQQYADEDDLDDQLYHDFDDVDDYSDDSISTEEKITTVGKIGKLFDCPLELLNPVTIEIQSGEGMRNRLDKANPEDIEKGPRGEVYGIWYSGISTIVLNREWLTSKQLQSTITHELRHALDDYKSKFQANKDSGSYSIPKKKEHRKAERDPELGNLNYVAQPAEINARFVQVLNAMVPVIGRAVKLSPEKVEPLIMREFKRALEYFRITSLFPEKERSKDYKRLMKRGIDFIQKELAFAKSTQNH